MARVQGTQFGAEHWVFLCGIGPSRGAGLVCWSPSLPWGAEGKSPVGGKTVVNQLLLQRLRTARRAD